MIHQSNIATKQLWEKYIFLLALIEEGKSHMMTCINGNNWTVSETEAFGSGAGDPQSLFKGYMSKEMRILFPQGRKRNTSLHHKVVSSLKHKNYDG